MRIARECLTKKLTHSLCHSAHLHYFCIMKLRELLFLVLCTALFGACAHDEMQRRLAEVDSLTDAHYDSALVLLARMDSLPMRRADRMYLELLRGKAMNKVSVPFTTDSVMRRVRLCGRRTKLYHV